jgi:hypothetical protein
MRPMVLRRLLAGSVKPTASSENRGNLCWQVDALENWNPPGRVSGMPRTRSAKSVRTPTPNPFCRFCPLRPCFPKQLTHQIQSRNTIGQSGGNRSRDGWTAPASVPRDALAVGLSAHAFCEWEVQQGRIPCTCDIFEFLRELGLLVGEVAVGSCGKVGSAVCFPVSIDQRGGSHSIISLTVLLLIADQRAIRFVALVRLDSRSQFSHGLSEMMLLEQKEAVVRDPLFTLISSRPGPVERASAR